MSTNCPTCRAGVLAGLDGDVLGFIVQVDLLPLSPLGELQAVLTNRRTYQLTGLQELDPRRAWHITQRPAATLTLASFTDVRVEHACGQSITAIALPPPTRRLRVDEPPPF